MRPPAGTRRRRAGAPWGPMAARHPKRGGAAMLVAVAPAAGGPSLRARREAMRPWSPTRSRGQRGVVR
eukprot:4937891-Alexandrium_andersonii.AAC.1